MIEKTQKEMTKEIWQGLYGVPDTEDRGMFGDFKEMIKHIQKQNGRIRKLEISVACIVVIGGGGYGIAQLIGA